MKNVITCLVLILFAQACGKKEHFCQEHNTIKVPKVVMDYAYFKTGTYWVYTDSLQSTTDSFWVQNSTDWITTTEKLSTPCVQELRYYLHANNFETTIHSIVNAYLHTGPDIRHNYMVVNQQQQTMSNCMRTSNGQFNYGSTLEEGRFNTFANITINGQTYSNIVEYVPKSQDKTHWFSKAYFAPNSGIVQYINVRNGKRMSLAKYNVVQ